MPSENQNQSQENLSFEKAIEKLEKLVSQMEQGKLPLEEMMQKFEEANKLASLCSAKLKEVEQKIELLVTKNSPNPEYEDFNFNESQPQTRKSKTKHSPDAKPINDNVNDTENSLF